MYVVPFVDGGAPQAGIGVTGLLAFVVLYIFLPETSHPGERGVDKATSAKEVVIADASDGRREWLRLSQARPSEEHPSWPVSLQVSFPSSMRTASPRPMSRAARRSHSLGLGEQHHSWSLLRAVLTFLLIGHSGSPYDTGNS